MVAMAKKMGVHSIILLFIAITTVDGLRPPSLNEGSTFVGQTQTQTRTLTEAEIDARFHAQGRALAQIYAQARASASSHVSPQDYARFEAQLQALAEIHAQKIFPNSHTNSHAHRQARSYTHTNSHAHREGRTYAHAQPISKQIAFSNSADRILRSPIIGRVRP